MEKHFIFARRFVMYTTLLLTFFIFIIHPALALETESRIHTGEATIGIDESYELYQGYGVKLVEPSPSGTKIIMEIDIDGIPVDGDIFINQDEEYRFTRKYDDEDYLVLAVTLVDVDTDDWTSTLEVTQYIDPSRSTSGFFIIDEEESLSPDEALPLKQDYSLDIKKLESDSVVLTLYKEGVRVQEEELERGDTFNYSVEIDGRDYTVVTFDLKNIFKGATRSAVFIEHLYQFEEPSNTGPEVTVSAAGTDSLGSIYEDNEVVVTYSLSGTSLFSSVTVTLDGSVIEESDTTTPGTHTKTLEPLSAGNHIMKVAALSAEGILASDETEVYVRKGTSTEPIIPEGKPIPAPTVFAGASILMVLWAGIRTLRRKRRD